MSLFKRSKPKGRADLLEEAAKARLRRRYRKAVDLYREALDRDPNDAAVEGRLAACLVLAGNRSEAWVRYRSAAEGYVAKGFVDKAAALLREAVPSFPREPYLWERMSALHLERARKSDAVSVLLEGRGHLRRGRDREVAERLLVAALRVDPHHMEAGVDLARLLAGSGRKEEARRLLDRFLPGATRRERRRIRALLFRMSPTPAALWRWIVAA